MEIEKRRYPLGIQTFGKIIDGNYQYIDKTEYVYQMTHSDSNYIFLSRPRRFGKSLLVSTLEAYFEGRKELFRGLAMERLETEWAQYPILRFDMSRSKHMDEVRLTAYLHEELRRNAERLGVELIGEDVSVKFSNLIADTSRKYQQNVVLLIDEYDAPLLDVVHEDVQLPKLRHIMRNFYSPIKFNDPYLRFVFLTGITKFSQLSIFSELNNIKNISMLPEYASICGITEEEMISQLHVGIDQLAEARSIGFDEAVQALKNNYDGYHFTWPSPDIYNPFSLLNALADSRLDSYWFGSGTPTYLIEMLRKFNVMPSQLGGSSEAMASSFDAPTERMTSITPLLYQSGYTTIKDCDTMVGLYTLGIPNKEIRIGLMQSLIPNYLGYATEAGLTTTALMQRELLRDDMDAMLRKLQEFLATVPQADNMNKAETYEGHWQQLLYIIFSLLGAHCDVEVRTPTGRVDLVVRTTQHLYLVEVKLNKSAEAAMKQINLKDYDKRFALCGLPVVKVGVNFSQEERNITDWEMREA